MPPPPFPPDETARLQRLEQTGALTPSRDAVLDALVEQALILFPGADTAAVTLLSRDTQWFKAIAGLSFHSTPRAQAFCGYTVLQPSVLVVEDAVRDPRFTDNPLVNGPPGIRFYAGAALGGGLGALCVIGLQSRLATTSERQVLAVLARSVDQRLDLHRAVRELTHSAA